MEHCIDVQLLAFFRIVTIWYSKSLEDYLLAFIDIFDIAHWFLIYLNIVLCTTLLDSFAGSSTTDDLK